MEAVYVFYVITVSGHLWVVNRKEKDEGGKIKLVIKVIDQKRKGSIKQNAELQTGGVVGITSNRGICRYDPLIDVRSRRKYPLTVGESGKRSRGCADFTDTISVLCLTQENARLVLTTFMPYMAWDWRFLGQTMEVLGAIPVDDPLISVDLSVRKMMDGVNYFVQTSAFLK